MNVAKNTVVTVHYRMSDAQGNLIDEGLEPMVYLHGCGSALPKIEEALEGRPVGFETTVSVQPQEAFGEYDEDLVRVESREMLPVEPQAGMQFKGTLEGDDSGQTLLFTVTQVEEDRVVLDGNHPLAGLALQFELTIGDVRPASEEEIAHGHVHHAA